MTDQDGLPSAPPRDTHMKPLLAVAVREAVVLAIIDSVATVEIKDGDIDAWMAESDAQRGRLAFDIYQITPEEWGSIDPGALAQNVACRLFGDGGWTVNGVCSGNASPREVLDACVHRPDRDPLGDIKHALGSGDWEVVDG